MNIFAELNTDETKIESSSYWDNLASPESEFVPLHKTIPVIDPSTTRVFGSIEEGE